MPEEKQQQTSKIIVLIEALFTAKFFELPQVDTSIDPKIYDFCCRPEQINDFFYSIKGRIYKLWLRSLVSYLGEFAEKNNIPIEAAREFFTETFIEYDGSDSGLNIIYFALYTEGMRALAGINLLLKQHTIPLAYKIDIIRNLSEGLDVCGPGVTINLFEAYEDLQAYLSLPMKLHGLRKKIAQQISLEQINNYRVDQGNITHYINCTIEPFAKKLGLNIVFDSLSTICDPVIVTQLRDIFSKEITFKLTVVNVINQIVTSLAAENALTNISNKDKPKKIKNIERKLAVYGQDNYKFLQEDEILETTDHLTYHPSWKINPVLMLSLYHRLAHAGFINIIFREKTLQEGVLYYPALGSIKFAYIKLKLSNTFKYVPFLTYLIEAMLSSNAKIIEEIGNFIRTDAFNENHYREIINTYWKFKRTNIFKALSSDELMLFNSNSLLPYLGRKLIIYSLYDLYSFLKHIPKLKRHQFLLDLNLTKFKKLHDKKDPTAKILCNVIKLLEPSSFRLILFKLPITRTQLAFLLAQIGDSLYPSLLTALDWSNRFKYLANITNIHQSTIKLAQSIPQRKRLTFFKALEFMQYYHFTSIDNATNIIITIGNVLSDHDLIHYLRFIEKKHHVLLRLLQHVRDIFKIYEVLTSKLMKICDQKLTLQMKSIGVFQTIHDLLMILAKSPGKKILPGFLNLLEPCNITKLFQNLQQIIFFIRHFSWDDRLATFKQYCLPFFRQHTFSINELLWLYKEIPCCSLNEFLSLIYYCDSFNNTVIPHIHCFEALSLFLNSQHVQRRASIFLCIDRHIIVNIINNDNIIELLNLFPANQQKYIFFHLQPSNKLCWNIQTIIQTSRDVVLTGDKPSKTIKYFSPNMKDSIKWVWSFIHQADQLIDFISVIKRDEPYCMYFLSNRIAEKKLSVLYFTMSDIYRIILYLPASLTVFLFNQVTHLSNTKKNMIINISDELKLNNDLINHIHFFIENIEKNLTNKQKSIINSFIKFYNNSVQTSPKIVIKEWVIWYLDNFHVNPLPILQQDTTHQITFLTPHSTNVLPPFEAVFENDITAFEELFSMQKVNNAMKLNEFKK